MTIVLYDFGSGLPLQIDPTDANLTTLAAVAPAETSSGLAGSSYFLTSVPTTKIRVRGQVNDVRAILLAAAATAAATAAAIAAAIAALSPQPPVNPVLRTPALAQIWANGWNSPQSYGRFISAGARLCFETNAATFILRAYVTSAAIDPVFGVIAVRRGEPGDVDGVLISVVTPPAAAGMVDTLINIGGVPGTVYRIFVDTGSLSGFIGYQPQSVLVAAAASFQWISPPVARVVAFDGWGSRLCNGTAITFGLGDGYVVAGGVIINGPGNAYLNLRATYASRVAQYKARWWLLRLGVNDGQSGLSAADYQVGLGARITDIIANGGAQLLGVRVSAPVRLTTVLGGSTLPAWWAAYQTAAAAAVAAVGGIASFHDSTNDWQFSDLSLVDGIHGVDVDAENRLMRSIAATVPDALGTVVIDCDSIPLGSTNPAIPAMAYSLPPQLRALMATTESADSGTYVPALTNIAATITNLAAVGSWAWNRVGRVYFVSGRLTHDVPVNAGGASFDVSLPVAAASVQAADGRIPNQYTIAATNFCSELTGALQTSTTVRLTNDRGPLGAAVGYVVDVTIMFVAQ